MAARSDTRSDSPSGRRGAGGKYAVAAIILVALLLRLGAGWWWQSRLPADSRFGFADSEAFATHLVTNIGVVALPGSAFFRVSDGGRQLMRFCFCKKDETLDLADARLARLA